MVEIKTEEKRKFTGSLNLSLSTGITRRVRNKEKKRLKAYLAGADLFHHKSARFYVLGKNV